MFYSVQGTLDAVVVSTPRQPPFTPEGLLDHITELIVTQDEVNHPLSVDSSC
jgi:hypothetical protein